MNKKVLTLSAVMASMLFGAAAHAADTRIGVTIYKYDDNFMSVVRKAIEQDAKAAPDVQLLMNDSQNDQSKQNDQIDVLLAKGVKALAINLVDPAAAGTVIEKARGQNVPVVFFNKEPSRKALDSYDKAYYVGTDSKESGIIQGDLIAKHWAANQGWDLNKDGQIQFVLLKGEPGHPDAEARTTYVIKELNDKGIKTEQLQLDTAMWDTAQAKDKMDAWLSGPNANKIEVVIANNDAMAMGAVEALMVWNLGWMEEKMQMLLWMSCGFGFLFGAYFFFTEEVLPGYYDENRINYVTQGIFRMNIPGVYFNNRNWPVILRWGRIWTVVTAVAMPLLLALGTWAGKMVGKELCLMIWLVYLVSMAFAIIVPARKYEFGAPKKK